MDIRISGHQVETGDALKAHVADRLQGIASKYFERAISAEVTFGKGPHDVGFKCDIVAHIMRGLILKGRHEAQDAHRAFDAAAEKIEKQLRRYMRRLRIATPPKRSRSSRPMAMTTPITRSSPRRWRMTRRAMRR